MRKLSTVVALAMLLGACGSAAKTSPKTTASHGGAATAPAKKPVLNSVFSVKFSAANCPVGTPATTSCYLNVGHGAIPSLGHVTERYTLLLETANASCADSRATAQWTVARKSAIDFALTSPGCVNPNSPSGSMNYTVTGGSGTYAGASGSGTLNTVATETPPGTLNTVATETPPGSGNGVGTDTWTGSLSKLR